MTSFRSVHLTEEAFEQANILFESVASEAAPGDASPLSQSGPDWRSFDSVYLYLYRLTLLRRHAEKRRSVPRPDAARDRRSDPGAIKVEHMLDMELSDDLNPRHLLSEFAVHALMDFRSAFRAAVELDAEVTDVDVGCVMLVFDVYPPVVDGPPDGRSSAVFAEAARSLVDRRLSSDHWIEVSRRYLVKHQWIDGCLTF